MKRAVQMKWTDKPERAAFKKCPGRRKRAAEGQ
jgi:hypothetical protein